MYVCLCCCTKPRDWPGKTSAKWSILCRVGRKTLIQSIPSLHWCRSLTKTAPSNTIEPQITVTGNDIRGNTAWVPHPLDHLHRMPRCQTTLTPTHGPLFTTVNFEEPPSFPSRDPFRDGNQVCTVQLIQRDILPQPYMNWQLASLIVENTPRNTPINLL